MTINKQQFLAQFNMEKSLLDEIEIEWATLENIYEHYVGRATTHQSTGDLIQSHLSTNKEVHSLRFRIKEPFHLLEKIIRKKKADKSRVITVDNYEEEITDLVGIRVLHLFKNGWRSIHDDILNTWDEVVGVSPIAYIRGGDNSKFFEEAGCKIENHPRGYRSVHYVIQCAPTRAKAIAEIQVRTIFEEGWSEVDHRIAYPYSVEDGILNEYLSIFNLLAGASDQMATFITQLRGEITKYRAEQNKINLELKETITRLEKLNGELSLAAEEKERLQGIVDTLKGQQATIKKSSVTNPYSTFPAYPNNDSIFTNASPLISTSALSLTSTSALPLTSIAGIGHVAGAGNLCEKCKDPLPYTGSDAYVVACKKCGQINMLKRNYLL